MRIGTNHGSLSDRIMSRYGDTPLGMVESAMEFIRIAEDERFFDIILSLFNWKLIFDTFNKKLHGFKFRSFHNTCFNF